MKNEPIRTLFSRKHDIILPKLGVFLAGPTPPNGLMLNGWRRKVINQLLTNPELDPSMVVVSPEPENGQWSDIDHAFPKSGADEIRDLQIQWEWQYLNLCDVYAFWLPTYWSDDKSENFDPNIGPTSRWEFGYFLQEYLKDRNKKTFIVGAPEDAESVKWAKQMAASNGIKWHTLNKEDKNDLVATSFINEIKGTLINNKWKL